MIYDCAKMLHTITSLVDQITEKTSEVSQIGNALSPSQTYINMTSSRQEQKVQLIIFYKKKLRLQKQNSALTLIKIWFFF